MNTALVLFIYNRLDNLRKIITKIRKVKPKIIFIFTDRPKIKKHTCFVSHLKLRYLEKSSVLN